MTECGFRKVLWQEGGSVVKSAREVTFSGGRNTGRAGK